MHDSANDPWCLMVDHLSPEQMQRVKALSATVQARRQTREAERSAWLMATRSARLAERQRYLTVIARQRAEAAAARATPRPLSRRTALLCWCGLAAMWGVILGTCLL